jgi:oxygen-independent coproporphyrinogen-3 oxidase
VLTQQKHDSLGIIVDEVGYNIAMSTPIPLGLYIHIPWCIQKCPYCDFNSHQISDALPEAVYVDALLTDLEQDLELLAENRLVQSVFIGGGTPSLFAAESLNRLLDGVRQQIPLAEDAEITLEANPGTFEIGKFADFRALGITRLSIGIQSFQDNHLKRLGRIHNAAEAMTAIEMAQQAGFDNINLDLMFGLPEQTEAEALADIATALSFSPSHLSYYQLTLEPNTLFYRYPPPLPEHDALYQLQKSAQQCLADAGFQQYEISAYRQPGKSCRHNLNYWHFGDYLGIGAGAHGKISRQLPGNIIRTQKAKNPRQYLQQDSIRSIATITDEALPLEFVMNQLRLKQGFLLTDFQRLTGLPVKRLEPALSHSVEQGLLAMEHQRIFCTAKGWDFLDEVLAKFV